MLGPVMFNIEGYDLTAAEYALLKNPKIGGLILFARNFQDPAQLKKLMIKIRETRNDIIVGVDHEGGRVQRFLKGFTRLPNMQSLGAYYQETPKAALKLAHQVGLVMATELAAFDIDLSFAPVLDLQYATNKMLGNRSFGRDPKMVATLAQAVIGGMKEGGVACVGKHFPGHGFVASDSHLSLPIDERSLAEIEADDIQPFAILNAQLDAIMPAHVEYLAVDSQAATFSQIWLQIILRQKLNFKGVIISDDLNMKAAHKMGDLLTRAKAALNAGCDLILSCNDFLASESLVEALPATFCTAERGAHLARLRRRRGGVRSLAYEEAQKTIASWPPVLLEPTAPAVGDTVAESGSGKHA